MSIEVDIIPNVSDGISWNAIKERLFHYELPGSSRRLLGDNPLLIERRTNRFIDDAEALLPTHYYRFKLEENNTLGLGIDSNAQTYTNEKEYLEDFGRNLEEEKREDLASLWRSIGFSYSVSSGAGRNTGEMGLLVALAEILAELSNGYVLIEDSHVFNLPVGCYTAEQFKHVDTKLVHASTEVE